MPKMALCWGVISPLTGTSDTTFFERLVDESFLPEGSYVFVDKGYASARNRDILTQQKP
jgi:hypothetical protein